MPEKKMAQKEVLVGTKSPSSQTALPKGATTFEDLTPDLQATILTWIDGSSHVSSFLQTCKWATQLKSNALLCAGYLARQRTKDAIELAFRAKCDDATILRIVHWDGDASADHTHKLLEVLHRAAASGRAELVQEVLRVGKTKGLDANAIVSFHDLSDSTSSERPPDYITNKVFVPSLQSALHLAAAASQVEVIEKLLQWDGLDLNIKDEVGWTPLILAAHKGKAKACKALIAGGADPNARGYWDMTPLQASAHESNSCWGSHDRSPSQFGVLRSLLAEIANAPGVGLRARGSKFQKSALEMVDDKISYIENMIEFLNNMDFGCEWDKELEFQMEDDLMCVSMELESAKALKKAMQAKGF